MPGVFVLRELAVVIEEEPGEVKEDVKPKRRVRGNKQHVVLDDVPILDSDDDNTVAIEEK